MRRKITLSPDSWYLHALKKSPPEIAMADWDMERDGISRDDEVTHDDWTRIKRKIQKQTTGG